MWQFWLVVAGIFFVLEMMTVGFLLFWFSIGAIIALIVSLVIENVVIQTVVFLISSTVLLFLTKPFTQKFSQNDEGRESLFSIENKTGFVTLDINPQTGEGQVKVNGEIWSAKTTGNDIITKDTKIKVEKVEGVKLIVSPIKEKEHMNI